jgi:hypothetical protein
MTTPVQSGGNARAVLDEVRSLNVTAPVRVMWALIADY